MSHGTEHHNSAFSLPLAANQTAIDPVCGMTVDPASAAGSFAHAGTTYHFCSRHCLEKFKADPNKYSARLDRGDLLRSRGSRCSRSEIYLPDAPGDRARRPRRLPQVRHGAGADDAAAPARRTTPNCAT